MSNLPRQRSLAWAISMGAVLAALYFSVPWFWLNHWEADTVDFRFRLRGLRQDASPVVVVGIADSSFTIAERAPSETAREPVLARMGEKWPWDRRVFAAVVEKLAAAGARAIVFDVVLASETPGDSEFASALSHLRIPVVLAKEFLVHESIEGERSVSVIEPRECFIQPGSRVRTGFANIWPEDDGVVRLSQAYLSREELLGAPRTASGQQELSPGGGAARLLGRPPRSEGGFVDFGGSADAQIILPIENLFLPDRWAGSVIRNGAIFKDKVVVIGPLSEVRFKDFHATPFRMMTGVELQANVIDSLLGRGLLKAPALIVEQGLVILAAVFAGLICLWLGSARWQVTALIGVVGAWLAISQAALAVLGFLLPIASPLGALLTAGSLGIGLRYTGEQRERRRFRSLLSSYVSEQVAEVISRQPENLSSAFLGERRPVTVLFSDLRGFTRLTEQMPPAALVAQLNEYLHAMVDCILAEGGTVQKFIGDAVLAVWGDTHSTGESGDASRAVAAALAMEAALVKLNAGWTGRADRVQLQMGIGLHQGVVTVGNLGHPRRMEFGVLGDAVNIASRLEGATKYLGITLLAGEPVAKLAAATHGFARVGRLQVLGREGTIDVFSPIAASDEAAALWLQGYNEAVKRLETHDIAGAIALFLALDATTARQRAVTEFRLRRAREALAASPCVFRRNRNQTRLLS